MPRASCNNFAWAALSLIGLALPGFAQTAVLAGAVTETLHGKPVPDVMLQFRRGPTGGASGPLDMYAVSTDSEGRYRIENLSEGRYTPLFSLPGYVWAVRPDGTTDMPQPFALKAGEEHVLDLRLTPAGVISGRILDSDGDPQRNVPVAAYANSVVAGVGTGSRAIAVSNDRGEYRLYNLAPGNYHLQATSPNNSGGLMYNNEQIRGPRPPEGFITTYYPNLRDEDAAGTIQVKPGEEISHVDIRLIPAMLYTVRLKAQAGSSPDTYLTFTLQPTGGQNQRNSSSGMNGAEFRGVLPGSYMLTGVMRAMGGNPVPLSYSRTPVEVVDRDVEVEAPAFAPPFDVAGSIVVDAPPPFGIQDVHVTLRRDASYGYIQDPGVVVSGDATLGAHGVLPEVYSLSATVPAGAYLKGIKLGNRELPDLHLDFSNGAAPLTVLLATDGGHIRGSVENAAGEPAARAPVTLYPEGSQRDRQDRAKTVGTNSEGSYEFKDVAPGDYRIFAWDATGPAPWRDPEYRKKYQAQSVTVTVEAHGDLVVALKTVLAEK